MSSSPATRPESVSPSALPATTVTAWGARPEPLHVDIPLSYYWLLIRRYQGRILTLVLAVTAAVAVLAFSTSKTYESTVIVRVDPSGLRVVGDPTQAGGGTDGRLLVSTEANVITSPAVEQELIDTLHLGSIAEFQSNLPPTASAMARQNQLLANVARHISVSQPLDTYLVDIHFTAKDPALAARAANGLAKVFLEHEYATRAKALTDSTAYMSDQINVLRARMERDQTALVNYESANDVINADDKSNIYQARLSQINNELTNAQATRMALQADVAIASSGNLDGLLASSRGQALVPLRDRLLSDQRELNHLGTIYGPAHPLYRQQEMVVRHDQTVLHQQEQDLAAQIRDQYEMALRDEQLLSASLQAEKQSVDAFNLRAVRYQALKAAADSSTTLYYDLQRQIQDATVAAGQRSEDLRIISPAIPNSVPVAPRIVLWIAFAFLLSTLGGIGAAIMVGVLDKSISSPEQVERWFNVPVIGSLPQVAGKSSSEDLSPRLAAAEGFVGDGETEGLTQRRRSSFQEAILALHSALAFALDGEATAMAVTSSIPGEGKSTIISNLAVAFGAMGRRTVLVDADLRKPSMRQRFGVTTRRGLSNLLQHRCALGDVLVPIAPNLTLVTAGSTVNNPAELLHLRFEEVLEQLASQFDFVLVDCPPVLGFADASHVAKMVGRVLVVAHAGATDRGNLNAALRQLSASGANVLGVVLNRISADLGSYYGYYSHYDYKNYAPEESDVQED